MRPWWSHSQDHADHCPGKVTQAAPRREAGRYALSGMTLIRIAPALRLTSGAARAMAPRLSVPCAVSSPGMPTFLGDFIIKHLPRRQHDAFRRAVLEKLSYGRPGDAAFQRSMALAALEFGFKHSQLDGVGLSNGADRIHKVSGITG